MKRKLLIVVILIICLVHIRFELKSYRLPGLTIEFCRGIAVDEDGNGKAYNGEPYYNYISYKGTDAQTGDEITTTFIYNPLTLYYDDILFRVDYNERTGKYYFS